MKKRIFAILIAVIVLLVATVPAAAITDGELDGNGHPFVGLMVALDADDNPLWRCSGTMISPTIFLTAGHCTEPPAAKGTIWFDADVESGIPGNGYPFVGDVTGTAYTHPQYNPNAFFLYDLGVVELAPADALTLDNYGELPLLDELDVMATKRGKQDTTFVAVGYGLQRINPVFVEAERIRMVAYPQLIQINVPGYVGDFSILLSNNHSTGGTCFGDSGGPNFIHKYWVEEVPSYVVGGVTSFGKNGNCAGTGGVYRVDRWDDLKWLCSFGVGTECDLFLE